MVSSRSWPYFTQKLAPGFTRSPQLYHNNMEMGLSHGHMGCAELWTHPELTGRVLDSPFASPEANSHIFGSSESFDLSETWIPNLFYSLASLVWCSLLKYLHVGTHTLHTDSVFSRCCTLDTWALTHGLTPVAALRPQTD